MANLHYVTHIDIPQATIKITRNADGTYDAILKAAGVSFSGRGRSVRTAAADTFRKALNERRGSDKGSPTKRYRVAKSVL
jgi:hypothetical protein